MPRWVRHTATVAALALLPLLAGCGEHTIGATKALPPFLNGLSEQWSDDATSDPLANGSRRWDEVACERQDHVEEGSFDSVTQLLPGRFIWQASGGSDGGPYYRFHAPAADEDIYSGGLVGRCELAYPVGNPGGSIPAHPGPPGAFFFYPGRRQVTMFDVRLPASGWDVNAPGWRLVAQWKQNEWVSCPQHDDPALDLEQRDGNWIITHFGGPILWSMPATAGRWVRFAFDITYAGKGGTVKVYADTNNDGTYEYSSGTWTGQTLADCNGRVTESTFINGLYEKRGGDTIDKDNLSIWG